MKRIWAPWRMGYIVGKKKSGCFFCQNWKTRKDNENYTFHPTRKTLKNELSPYLGFKIIDKLLGRPTPKSFQRPSQEYWNSVNWVDANRKDDTTR